MSGSGEVLAYYGPALANLGADDLLEFFFMAEVKGKMAKEDPRNRLVEDCARFVSERGCTWSGMAAVCERDGAL